MKADERLKEIEAMSIPMTSETDVRWLIARVKRLTEDMQTLANCLRDPKWVSFARDSLEEE